MQPACKQIQGPEVSSYELDELIKIGQDSSLREEKRLLHIAAHRIPWSKNNEICKHWIIIFNDMKKAFFQKFENVS